MSDQKPTPEHPHDRQIVQAIFDLWKKDPTTEALGIAKLHARLQEENPTWPKLKTSTVRSLMKEYGLHNASVEYAKDIRSKDTPHYSPPEGVKVIHTAKRGKSLYATKDYEPGDVLWSEAPFIEVPKLDCLELIRKSHACAYCSRPFQNRKRGVSCPQCDARWCSPECKKKNHIHRWTWHTKKNSPLQVQSWTAFERFCTENNWVALYQYAVALLYAFDAIEQREDSTIMDQLESFATISQEERAQAITVSNLEKEALQTMWKEGHKLLRELVKEHHELTYQEMLNGVGMFNLNNLDGNLYLTYAHLNHACNFNVKADIKEAGEGVAVVAVEPIKSGQELHTSYVNPETPLEQRRKTLRENWGFTCQCARCKHELNLKNTPNEPRQRRKSVHFPDGVE